MVFFVEETSLKFQVAVARGLEEQLQVMEESRGDAEERLRSQVAANSTLRATNVKLSSHIHALNNDITELQAVSN